MYYRLKSREFSRQWRRNVRYKEKDLKWLARGRGLEIQPSGENLQVVNPDTKKVIVTFEPIKEERNQEKDEEGISRERRQSIGWTSLPRPR